MEEIELREYFLILWKRVWIIALITILSVATSGIVSFFVLEPEYETYTTLMVGRPKDYIGEKMDANDIRLNQMLVNTYGELAKSRKISDEVIKNLGLDITPGALSGKTNVSLVRNTEIIQISVTDYSPKMAADIANETALVFMKHVSDIMKIENIQVIDEARVPTSPIKPRPKLNMAISAVLGLMISVFIIFLLEYLDNTIKTPSDVERHLGLPILGMIPKSSK